MISSHTKKGLSVLEVIIGAAIIMTIVTVAASAWQINISVAKSSLIKSQAALIVEETGEILQLFRDENWTTNIAALSLNTPYQLAWSTNKFVSTSTQNLIQGKYVRTFTLSAVSRNSNDDITSGGTNDPDTRKATITVFLVGATSTPLIETEMLIHNIYAN